MSRHTVSLLVVAAALLLLITAVPDVLLLVFAGILIAVFLHGGGGWIAARLHIGDRWGVLIFLPLLAVALFGVGTAAAPAISAQIDEFVRLIPEVVESAVDRIESYSWGPAALRSINPEALTSGMAGTATTAVTSTLGALGSFVLILFIGLYVALTPDTYRRGVRALFAPDLRAQADRVLAVLARTLRQWLGAQLMAMAAVGVLTGLGLWVLGVPLALLLGLIAALLTFIPNIGPVLAAVPAVLLALPQGLSMVAWVIALYVVVQSIEGYLITPLLQQDRVSLPPALTIGTQLLFWVLFGIVGLALATPIAAVGLVLVRVLYVEAYLEHDREAVVREVEEK